MLIVYSFRSQCGIYYISFGGTSSPFRKRFPDRAEDKNLPMTISQAMIYLRQGEGEVGPRLFHFASPIFTRDFVVILTFTHS